jgi:hypothetical protein
MFGHRRPGVRIRAWVIGAALIVSGIATHVVFEVWVAPSAGRIEMGQFACLEAVLYATGLGLSLISLCVASAQRTTGRVWLGWVLWVVVGLTAGLAVLRQLPP